MKTPEGFRVAAINGDIVAKLAPGKTTGSPVKILFVGLPVIPVEVISMVSVTASLL
jgi:hypothetical protein